MTLVSKNVKHLIPAQRINMGGIFVKQALPTVNVPDVDPFLLLHHGEFKFRSDAPAHHQGVGPHPHRGFSPVTFVVNGEIHHRDSHGNNQVAKAGEVQWMHAGAGIIHSERPTTALVENGDIQEIIQLWINTPSARKMDPPHYKHLSGYEITKMDLANEGIVDNLVAGAYSSYIGIETMSPMSLIWSHGTHNGVGTYMIEERYHTMIYVIKGKISIGGYGIVDAQELCVFEIGGTEIRVELLDDSQYLILSGEPLKERIVQHGPFVMNSQTQIIEAMRDYQMGKMGILIED